MTSPTPRHSEEVLAGIARLEALIGKAPNEEQWLADHELFKLRDILANHEKVKLLIKHAEYLDMMVSAHKTYRAIRALFSSAGAYVAAAIIGAITLWDKVSAFIVNHLGGGLQ